MTDYGLRPPGKLSACAAYLEVSASKLLAAAEAARARNLTHPTPEPTLVALGSGSAAPDGWYGVDLGAPQERVFHLDLRRGLPFPSASVQYILAEHVLEHLYLDDLERLLRECYRVTRRGGGMRVISPDARLIARLLTEEETAADRAYVHADHELHGWTVDALARFRTANRLSHQWGQHKALLSPSCVRQLLLSAGFDRVSFPTMGSSDIMESPPDVHQIRFGCFSHESFVVEALRC